MYKKVKYITYIFDFCEYFNFTIVKIVHCKVNNHSTFYSEFIKILYTMLN